MGQEKLKFIDDSIKISFDRSHRKKIKFNMTRYHNSVKKGKLQYTDLELARNRASFLKQRVIENLNEYLIEFESRFLENGGKLIYAVDSDDAIQNILSILNNYKSDIIVKSKSIISEEIHLNEELQKINNEPIETDLGEFIVQIAGEKPYHIITPAMHKSKEDVAKLFNEKYNLKNYSTPEEITAFVRSLLREKFYNSDIGFTGVNFMIAETGSICLTENEGNGVLTMSFPKIHIAIAGIEKIIPKLNDLNTYWPLLSTYGTGQNVTVYNSIISGPKKENEIDGPEELYLILLDNGRTKILDDKKVRDSLKCIRCGSCLNNCPIYHTIGGYTYDVPYSGPIGKVISQYLFGYEEYAHLTQACSVCGKCKEECPVKIDLPKIILRKRNSYSINGPNYLIERIATRFWSSFMLKRKWIDKGKPSLKRSALKLIMKNNWGKRRQEPYLADKSFNKLWREKNNIIS